MFFMVLAQAQDFEVIPEKKDPQAYCLAQNIYFEASTEPMIGKIAVGMVVINRVKDARYPNTICDVVKQGPVYESWTTRAKKDLKESERIYIPIKHKCQFSWYCDGKGDDVRPTVNWYKSQIIALQILEGKWSGILEGATHYHATWVSPKWRHELTYIGQAGDHLFYRWEK
jgi:spore germination cell wall hydrolase CwlJ-like protein